MLFPIKNRQELENLEELALLKNQVEEVPLQDKLGKPNFHDTLKKVFERVTDTIKNTSESLTKYITEISIKNNKAIENLNDKFLEILNDRGVMAFYVMSPLSKITNPEITTQFILVKDSNSNNVNDLLIHKTLYNNLLDFRDTGKKNQNKKRSFKNEN